MNVGKNTYIYIYLLRRLLLIEPPSDCRRCRPSHRRRTRAAAGRRGAVDAVDAVDVVGPSRRGTVRKTSTWHSQGAENDTS